MTNYNVHNWSHQIGPSSGNLKGGKIVTGDYMYYVAMQGLVLPKILADAFQVVIHTLLIFSPSL